MSYGFTATNAAGQVLVSSQTRNLHLLLITTATTLIAQHDAYGGMRHWAYRFTSNRTPVPFFELTDEFTGITALKLVSVDTWEVSLVYSGLKSTPPKLFVFADPVGRTSEQQFGVRVLMDDGTAAFDSRFSPLSINFSTLTAPPLEPLGPSGVADLTPVRNVDSGFVSTPYPIASYSALAQCERRRTSQWEVSGDDGSVGKYKINPWTEYHTGVTWAFYRSGVRLLNNSQLNCGWVCVKHGYYEEIVRNSVSTLGNILTVGGEGNNSSSGSSGALPYSNETLNLQPSAVILSNGNLY